MYSTSFTGKLSQREFQQSQDVGHSELITIPEDAMRQMFLVETYPTTHKLILDSWALITRGGVLKTVAVSQIKSGKPEQAIGSTKRKSL